MKETITARFPDRETLDCALNDLRRLGAAHYVPCADPSRGWGAATLCMTVSVRNASLARAVVRRAGGELIF